MKTISMCLNTIELGLSLCLVINKSKIPIGNSRWRWCLEHNNDKQKIILGGYCALHTPAISHLMFSVKINFLQTTMTTSVYVVQYNISTYVSICTHTHLLCIKCSSGIKPNKFKLQFKLRDNFLCCYEFQWVHDNDIFVWNNSIEKQLACEIMWIQLQSIYAAHVNLFMKYSVLFSTQMNFIANSNNAI